MAKKTKRQTKRDNRNLIKYTLNCKSTNLPIDIKFGRFTAARVCLEESAINNKVLRVSVQSLVNGVITNQSKGKSFNKPNIQRKFAKKTNIRRSKNFKIDRRLLLRRRTRSGHRSVARKNVPFKVPLISFRKSKKLPKKRPNMSSIEAMIPEFKINKSIKKTPTKPTPPRQTNYKYLLKSTNSSGHAPSRLCLDFIELPKILRSIKLPDPSWKVKIFMKDIMRMSISITNNKRPERCVIFTSKNESYQIIIDDKPVRLLACPDTLSDRKDFETLIQIVSCISVDDCMVSPITEDNF